MKAEGRQKAKIPCKLYWSKRYLTLGPTNAILVSGVSFAKQGRHCSLTVRFKLVDFARRECERDKEI